MTGQTRRLLWVHASCTSGPGAESSACLCGESRYERVSLASLLPLDVLAPTVSPRGEWVPTPMAWKEWTIMEGQVTAPMSR